jgi:tetratricopeptide (TPR) repeat protein
MQLQKITKQLILAQALTALGVSGAAVAQDVDSKAPQEETLEMIELDRFGDDQEIPNADEGFDDVVFDEATQSYKLIEDDGGDDWVEPASERETQADELQRLFDLYREALSNQDYLEADTLAKRVVELSIEVYGLDSHDSAKAVTNLGIAQHNNGDFEAALRNFIASIDIVERIDDNLSPALINPLQGLAATQAAMGRPDLARLSYQRAVHVSHVNEGPHNPDQVKILDSMAELHLSQGDFDEATDIQEHIFSIQSRKIDPESLDIIPALTSRAEWQHRLQRYNRERLTLRQIIELLEDHYGKSSLELIPPLTKLGKSYLYVNPVEYEYGPAVSISSGESYMRRALKIAEGHPDSNWVQVNDSILALTEYYLLSGRPNRASNSLMESWALLSEGNDPERLRVRRNELEQPKLLQRVYPPKYYNTKREDDGQRPPDNFEVGTINFGYNVSATGGISGIVHLETQPREIVDFHEVVGRAIRRMKYRPRMEEGRIVFTRDLVYTHEFYYRPSDLPAPIPAAGTESVSESETD